MEVNSMKTKILCAAMPVLAGMPVLGGPVPERPNILFIMADDMGAWAMGNAGHPNAVTPNLDRLASEGARLANHFSVSAVCSPSRACILTGKYSLETGVPDILGKNEDDGLDLSLATMPRAFQQAGYRTALVGKWHLGHADRFYPTRYGYDSFKGFRVGGKERPLSSQDPEVEINQGERRIIKGYTSDILTDLAMDFINESGNQPFFLSLNFWAPHANQGVATPEGDRTWLPLPDADWEPFKDLDPVIPNPDYPDLDIARVKRMTREYLGSVHSVDRNIGRLIAHLKERGILDRTIIVFTSDNGFNLGHSGIWHKGNGWWILTNNRGDRPNLLDHSMRVPAIVHWPAKIPPGVVLESANTSLDWFPTLCGLAGVPVDSAWDLRGVDLRKEILENQVSERPIFGQYRMWEWNQTGSNLRAYRTNSWKLVVDLEKKVPNEFYDLTRDSAERVNLFASTESRVVEARKQMEAALRTCMEKVGDDGTRPTPKTKLAPSSP